MQPCARPMDGLLQQPVRIPGGTPAGPPAIDARAMRIHRPAMRPALRALSAAIALCMLIAQLGVTMHSLHHDVKRSDSVCEFCTSGAHLQGAPASQPPAFVFALRDEPPALEIHSPVTAAAVHAARARAPPLTSRQV
jgi:hypothetical protein